MARKRRPTRSNRVSAILGGTLLLVGCLWLGWIVFGQHGGTPSFSFTTLPLPGLVPTNPTEPQIPALLAEGITLGHADQTPTLSQPQAMVLANQLEPDAATKAKSTTARYVLLNYVNMGTSATHSNISNVPVWMVWYQQIPLVPADASVDPTPFPHSTHDLYVFLDATNGKEVLSIWL